MRPLWYITLLCAARDLTIHVLLILAISRASYILSPVFLLVCLSVQTGVDFLVFSGIGITLMLWEDKNGKRKRYLYYFLKNCLWDVWPFVLSIIWVENYNSDLGGNPSADNINEYIFLQAIYLIGLGVNISNITRFVSITIKESIWMKNTYKAVKSQKN